jgi:hypothetical protein
MRRKESRRRGKPASGSRIRQILVSLLILVPLLTLLPLLLQTSGSSIRKESMWIAAGSSRDSPPAPYSQRKHTSASVSIREHRRGHLKRYCCVTAALLLRYCVSSSRGYLKRVRRGRAPGHKQLFDSLDVRQRRAARRQASARHQLLQQPVVCTYASQHA